MVITPIYVDADDLTDAYATWETWAFVWAAEQYMSADEYMTRLGEVWA